jgi:hypothetical protein
MKRCHLFLFALPLAAGPLLAQTYTAAKIHFSDPGTFTQRQLEDASGLHAGTSFTADDLSAAAQRLVDTGYFDDISASLEGKFTAITVKFVTKPTPRKLDDWGVLRAWGWGDSRILDYLSMGIRQRPTGPILLSLRPKSSKRSRGMNYSPTNAAVQRFAVNRFFGHMTCTPTRGRSTSCVMSTSQATEMSE